MKFDMAMRAFGAELFEELVPVEIQRVLWKYKDLLDSIQIIAREPFIPWEIVHLRNPDGRGMPDEPMFLAQKGMIRWMDGGGKDGCAAEEIRIKNGNALYVIPEYPHPAYKLPEAQKEKFFLTQEFEARELTPDSSVVIKTLSSPGAFDLFHFAGHGDANSGNINDALLLMRGRVDDHNTYVPDPLEATMVGQCSNIFSEENAPFVVLNACRAGRLGQKLTSVGGFAHAFLRAGAGAFVGALWSVGDSPARTFTEALYKQLINGATLAEATTAARETARLAGDATWLAYVVYGHPYLRINRH